MIEWDPAFRRDLDSTNWIENDIREGFAHVGLVDDRTTLAVGRGYLQLTERFLVHCRRFAIPLRLIAASEQNARLVLECEFIGDVDDEIRRSIIEITADVKQQSRRVCERCGDPGQPQIIRGGIDAHKVLCSTCQRLYDDAIFFDQAIPSMMTVIREYVAGYHGTFADLDRDIVDAFALPRLPKAGRRRTRAMLKRVWVEICLAIMRPEMKRWWHDA